MERGDWKDSDLTPKQRWSNWWYYNWKFVVLGTLLLCFLGKVIFDHVTEVKPDCGVALVTRYVPDPQETAALEEALEAVCPDVNGDGRVDVAINAIQIDYTSTDLSAEALRVMEANIDKLNFDFYTKQSGIFLLEDPDLFVENTRALSYLDGTTPPEDAVDWENMTRPWSDWQGGEGLELSAADELWFGRRVVLNEKDEEAFAGARALWDILF